jgi:hypothetical protein
VSRPKTAVHFYLEDGFLVRGTLDPHEALKLAVASGEFEEHYWCAEESGREWDDDQLSPDPETVTALGDVCHQLLSESRPGLYRIVPVGPNDWRRDDGYAWMVHRAVRRGLGVFEAVEFR